MGDNTTEPIGALVSSRTGLDVPVISADAVPAAVERRRVEGVTGVLDFLLFLPNLLPVSDQEYMML